MKTYVLLWYYLAQFSYNKSALDIFVEKIKTRFLAPKSFVRKSWRVWYEAEKYGRAGQDTEDNIKRRTPFEYCISKATNTQSEYEILTVLHDNNDFAKGSQY